MRAYFVTTLLYSLLSLTGCSAWFDEFDFGSAGGAAGNAGASGQTAGIDASAPCTSDTVCGLAFQCKSKICVLRR
jgi:hypothetical protein